MKKEHTGIAIITGLLAGVIIWYATPYNNFVMMGPFISDSYLPLAGLFLVLLIVLGIGPLMRLIIPDFAFSYRDKALIVSIILISSVVPGQGLLRALPYTLASLPTHVRENPSFAGIFAEMDLNSWLFPDRTSFGAETPVVDGFVNRLTEGESIPWIAWVRPVLIWGLFLVFCYMMMISLAMLLFPQWRRNERLSFPLLTVYGSIIEEPEGGHHLPALFLKKSFWIAAIGVFVIHLLAGWKQHDPSAIPAIPVQWHLGNLFSDGLLSNLPYRIHSNRVYFIFLGIAFFMPSRIGFSIWFFVLAYAGYAVITTVYFPPYNTMTITDHRLGGTIALTLVLLWLGRAHWIRVFKGLFRPPQSEEERRDRGAARMFITGCFGIFLWLVWMGVQPGWALAFIVLGFMLSLTITRLVAETGMPFIRIDLSHHMNFLRLFPNSWLTSTTLFFSYYIIIIFAIGTRVSCTTMATHSLGLHENEPPRKQLSLCKILLVVIMIGVVVGWAASLTANYHHGVTLNGQERPVCYYAYGFTNKIVRTVQDFDEGRYNPLVHSQGFHIGFGFVAVLLLMIATLVMPNWPLHPIGLLMVNTYYSNQAWASVFLGWMVKVLMLKYGGARIYRAAKPFFLGLIIGEVFSGILWSVIPVVLVLTGHTYERIMIQPY